MKHKFAIIFIIISSFSFSQKTIRGEVILFNSDDKELVAGKTYIYLKDDFHSVIATDSVFIDDNLKFEFKNIFRDSVNIFFRPRNYPYNVSYNIKLIGNEKKWLNLKIKYSPNCPYSKTNNICPKCHNSKKVVPIIYGLFLLEKDQADKVKLGGCVSSGCDPYWHCKKHKLNF
jgi:hypothetical protein